MSIVFTSLEIREVISENLQDALVIREWTQTELARRIFRNDTPTVAEKMRVSRWCSGKVLPDAAELANLAEVLGTSVDRLLQRKTL